MEKNDLSWRNKPMRFLVRSVFNHKTAGSCFLSRHRKSFEIRYPLKIESAPSFFFGCCQAKAIAVHRIAIVCFLFIKVNQLVVVPRVDPAVALIDLAVVLIFDRNERQKSIDIAYWSTKLVVESSLCL